MTRTLGRSKEIHLPLDEALARRWRLVRTNRRPDDPGPFGQCFEAEGFDIAPPDRGSSLLACIVSIVLCGAIIAAGFMVANGLGWLG